MIMFRERTKKKNGREREFFCFREKIIFFLAFINRLEAQPLRQLVYLLDPVASFFLFILFYFILPLVFLILFIF